MVWKLECNWAGSSCSRHRLMYLATYLLQSWPVNFLWWGQRPSLSQHAKKPGTSLPLTEYLCLTKDSGYGWLTFKPLGWHMFEPHLINFWSCKLWYDSGLWASRCNLKPSQSWLLVLNPKAPWPFASLFKDSVYICCHCTIEYTISKYYWKEKKYTLWLATIYTWN